MPLIVAPPAAVTVPVAGQDEAFPVRRIYCVGQNYGAHAKEMGGDPSKPPFFFSKPRDAAVTGPSIPYASRTERLDFEVELVVALKSGGRDLSPEAALACVGAYGVGIDWTRRDLQAAYKKDGKPWDMAKGFDSSASLGTLVPAEDAGDLSTGRIALSLDGELRQQGDLSDMIWNVPALLAELSRYVALAPGDLVFTGTPEGVGPAARGQTVTAEIADLPGLTVKVEA